MIFVNVLTTIFLLLQGSTIPTLYGGFQNVEIDNNKEMSLYIEYDDLFMADNLTFAVDFVDTSLNSAIYIDQFAYGFDQFALIQSISGTPLEIFPLLNLKLDSDSSSLFALPYTIYGYGDGTKYTSIGIEFIDEDGESAYNLTYLGSGFGIQMIEEFLRSYCEDFGGTYSHSETNRDFEFFSYNYTPDFEITLPFTFTNDLFFLYTVADYKNSYQSYSSINAAKDLIFNLGKEEVINNPGIYDLYTKTEYDQNYDRGYDNGKLDAETPVGLNWVKAAINVFFGFLGFMILPGVTLGDIFSGLIILLILKWVLGWFRG